jgi:nicotinamide-nucleotide amidase
MAVGARRTLMSDVAVSVTGLAGPGGDEYGNPIGTVYIGYSDAVTNVVREFHFTGDRDNIRRQAVLAALSLILEYN